MHGLDPGIHEASQRNQILRQCARPLIMDCRIKPAMTRIGCTDYFGL
jgi:hypothetical protein